MLATRGWLALELERWETPNPPAEEYGVLRFQRNMNSASKGCSGTGPFEALLFGQPHLAACP
jgi:hypothetical protein